MDPIVLGQGLVARANHTGQAESSFLIEAMQRLAQAACGTVSQGLPTGGDGGVCFEREGVSGAAVVGQ
jgi:hypothetical protein